MKRLLLLEHARRRGGAKVEPRHERDHLLRTGRLAQPALHAGILGEAQHRPVGIVRQRAGRAGRDARRGIACSPSTSISTAPNGAPAGQRDDFGRRRRRAVELAQRPNRSTSRLPPAGAKLAGRGTGAPASIARKASPSANGSSVSMVATRSPPKPSTGEDRLARARSVLSQARDIVARLGAQNNAHRRRAIGEGCGDASSPICVTSLTASGSTAPASRRRAAPARRSARRHAPHRGTAGQAMCRPPRDRP